VGVIGLLGLGVVVIDVIALALVGAVHLPSAHLSTTLALALVIGVGIDSVGVIGLLGLGVVVIDVIALALVGAVHLPSAHLSTTLTLALSVVVVIAVVVVFIVVVLAIVLWFECFGCNVLGLNFLRHNFRLDFRLILFLFRHALFLTLLFAH